jgi:hypothetical protein
MAENDVRDSMNAGQPWVEADRREHAVTPGVRNEQAGNHVDAITYPLISILNWRCAEQQHRRLGNDLGTRQPLAGGRPAAAANEGFASCATAACTARAAMPSAAASRRTRSACDTGRPVAMARI